MRLVERKVIVKLLSIFIIAAGANVYAGIDGGEIMFENCESNPEQRWRYVSDRVMGGGSTGKVIYA